MEQIEFLPRSIVRTLQRFSKQIGLKSDLFAIYEFRISRYILIASFQCFFLLIVCPWIFYFFFKFFILDIFLESPRIFINSNQQQRAFAQIQIFSQQFYFETFFQSSKIRQYLLLDFDKVKPRKFLENNDLKTIYQDYFLKCANFYNEQSLLIITNWILDFTTLLFFGILVVFLNPQLLVLKTCFIESLLNLNETIKCFFIIFFLDLFVGFHSSKSWEIFLQYIFEHFGFQIYQNPNYIFFFISTFPVFLDTIFKYWIFRYLNRISPSTVIVYQAMVE
uniref:Envelope membrane protein n=1 Tax=Chlorodesmis fastigiata TaxID=189431 RepID=A0A2P0QHD5_CHLFS|nr:envelope membrane protein [Chlorodesmis fastigiata]ARO74183.1 envelope membrane protein [Chlorodesmis fastigiata]